MDSFAPQTVSGRGGVVARPHSLSPAVGRALCVVLREGASSIARNTISRIVETVKTLDRPEDVAQTAAFFSEHPIEQAAKTLDQILERQRVNADVRARNEQPFRDALG